MLSARRTPFAKIDVGAVFSGSTTTLNQHAAQLLDFGTGGAQDPVRDRGRIETRPVHG